MVVNETILGNIENLKLRNQVLRKIKKMYDDDRVSDAVQHYSPSKDEEINIMAVPFYSKVDHVLNQLQEAGVFESWENKTVDNLDPAFCFYNVNRDFLDDLDNFLKEERRSERNRYSTGQAR